MKVIIAGPKDFNDYSVLSRAVEQSGFQITEVVSGKALGVDALGERWARERGIPIAEFPADWKAHGKFAGPKRNGEMADYADALVALWDGQSKGTGSMIKKAGNRRLMIYVHRFDVGEDDPT